MTTTTAPAYTPEGLMADYAHWHSQSDPTLIHAVDRYRQPACQFQRQVALSYTGFDGVTDAPVNCDTCLARIEARAAKANEQIAGWEAALMSGRRFSLVAASNRSARSVSGYIPKLNDRDYAQAFAYLADLAATGPMGAELAGAAIRRVNLHGTVYDMVAAVAESFAATMREPFDDVSARTGPEPCRYSDAQKPWPLAVRLKADATLSRIDALTRTHVGGISHWTLKLAERERVHVIARWAGK